MSKIKEITEEQFLILSAIGMPACWETNPYAKERTIRSNLSSVYFSSPERLQERRKSIYFKGVRFRFYTLVEDSSERSEDE